MKRIDQGVLIVTFLGFCWLAMQGFHELGHVFGAWVTGGEVVKVALHPTIISRTDLGYNSHPLLTVWAGPVIGSLLPLTLFLAARAFRFPGVYLFRFLAGFCLIANGVYIGFGPSEGAADSGIMMLHGSPRVLLIVFALVTVLPGLFLWHRQGVYFGLGEARGKVDRWAMIVSLLLFTIVVGVEWMIDSR